MSFSHVVHECNLVLSQFSYLLHESNFLKISLPLHKRERNSKELPYPREKGGAKLLTTPQTIALEFVGYRENRFFSPKYFD